MTYNPTAIQIANHILTLPNGRATQLYIKKNPEKVSVIYDNTSFLSPENTLAPRCYCILNNIHSTPICKICGQPVLWADKSFRTYCSRKCKGLDKDLKSKIKETVLLHYGVSNPSQSPTIKQQKINTCLITHGVEYPQQSKEVMEKSYNTMKSKYGCCRPIQNKQIKQQIKQTMMTKWGVENPSQSDTIQRKKQKTMIKLYGAHSSQQHMIDILPLIEDYNWLFNQYIELEKSATNIADELGINSTTIYNYLHDAEIEVRTSYNTSCNSISWLNTVSLYEDIHIQRALNGGEFKIPGTKYRADGYCKETNTIYEFHGDYWHGNPNIYSPTFYNKSLYQTMGDLYQKTIEREHKIKELGYNLVVMWESNFILDSQM